MMRAMTCSILMLALLGSSAVAAQAAPATLVGSWTASVSDKDDDDRLHFTMQTRRNNQNGTTFERSEFEGLSAAEVNSRTQVLVEFALVREAGTIRYEGTFRGGQGAGQFTFEADPEYPRKLQRIGVELNLDPKDREHELFSLTIFDVSTAYIRSMRDIGYDVALEKYVAFRIFHVTPEYVRDMASVGFKNLSADKLVETRIHGATPEYIREMRSAGQDLTLAQYIESRIFQVTPEFRGEMAKAGYSSIARDELVQFRIHGVTTEFIHELKELGYTRVPAQKLVEMRIHGVTPEFIRRLAEAGYKNVPIDKMVQMRIFDIKPEMVRALDDVGE